MEEKQKVAAPKNYKTYACTICCKDYNSVIQLNDHVMGYKHKISMQNTCPSLVPLLPSFQYFLDTYVQDLPLLGLEYVEEFQSPKRKEHRYACHLCGLRSNRSLIFMHITGVLHMQKYLERHHPDTSAYIAQFKDEHTRSKTLYQSASDIVSQHGRKKIQETVLGGPTPAKVAKYSSSENRRGTDPVVPACCDLRGDPAPCQDAKPRPPSEHADGGSGMRNNVNFSQFKRFDGFLAYMRDFEIQNEEGAAFVREIIQNCNKAVLTFQQEQANAAAQGAPTGSHPAPAHVCDAVAERVSHSSEASDKRAPPASRCADSSSLESEAMGKSDAIETFFSYIKNMEASQVNSILEKIAATIPAFKGTDVPSVMKYLQEAGRIKNR